MGFCAVLMGEYVHNLDKKGRFIVPARFREELGERFIITRGLDRCLFLYPLREWVSMEKEFRDLPLAKAEARKFTRILFSGAAEVEIDKQGRALIPPLHREYAGIEKEIVVIGVSSRAEVWSKANWHHYNDDSELSYEQVAERLLDF